MCHGKQCRMADCSPVSGRLRYGSPLGRNTYLYIRNIPYQMARPFVSFYQLFIVIGILAAYCADFGMISWGNNWRWMLGLPLLFAAGNLLMLLFLPESPRWLIRQGGGMRLPEKPSPAWGFLPKMRQSCLKRRKLRRKAGPNYPNYSADRWHTSSCWARCSPYVTLGESARNMLFGRPSDRMPKSGRSTVPAGASRTVHR